MDVNSTEDNDSWLQTSHDLPFIPTSEQQSALGNDIVILSDYKLSKLEEDAQKNWDLFYKRNTTAFYKDRHWTCREFPELKEKPLVLFEAGCGVGNFLFPLLQENPNVFAYACDFSPRAIEFVVANELYNESRCKAFQCDLTKDNLESYIPSESVDFCSLVFVLSAINPCKMSTALKNICKVLKADGSILIRDYGLYDHAMLRFKPGHKLGDNFYRRQDNTRAYYFSLEKLDELFKEAGFIPVERCYVQRRTVNKKENIDVPRIFVQGRYKKYITECSETKVHD